MNQFAKLFERPQYGQVAVVLRKGDDHKPELQCFVKPDGFGVCMVAIGFDEWDKAEKALEDADDEFADRVGATIFESMNLQPNA